MYRKLFKAHYDRLSGKTIVEQDSPQEALLDREVREMSFIQATLISSAHIRFQGIMTDVSDTGACLRFHTLSSVNEGDTIFVSAPSINLRSDAIVKWRSANTVGIAFVPSDR